jgi:hypothetical protein
MNYVVGVKVVSGYGVRRIDVFADGALHHGFSR